MWPKTLISEEAHSYGILICSIWWQLSHHTESRHSRILPLADSNWRLWILVSFFAASLFCFGFYVQNVLIYGREMGSELAHQNPWSLLIIKKVCLVMATWVEKLVNIVYIHCWAIHCMTNKKLERRKVKSIVLIAALFLVNECNLQY